MEKETAAKGTAEKGAAERFRELVKIKGASEGLIGFSGLSGRGVREIFEVVSASGEGNILEEEEREGVEE